MRRRMSAKLQAAYSPGHRQCAPKNGFTADEVAKAKEGYLQSRQLSRSQDNELAPALAQDAFLGRTLAWDAALEAKVSTLSPQQLQAGLPEVRRSVGLRHGQGRRLRQGEAGGSDTVARTSPAEGTGSARPFGYLPGDPSGEAGDPSTRRSRCACCWPSPAAAHQKLEIPEAEVSVDDLPEPADTQPNSYVSAPIVFDYRPLIEQIEQRIPRVIGSVDKEQRKQVVEEPQGLGGRRADALAAGVQLQGQHRHGIDVVRVPRQRLGQAPPRDAPRVVRHGEGASPSQRGREHDLRRNLELAPEDEDPPRQVRSPDQDRARPVRDQLPAHRRDREDHRRGHRRRWRRSWPSWIRRSARSASRNRSTSCGTSCRGRSPSRRASSGSGSGRRRWRSDRSRRPIPR